MRQKFFFPCQIHSSCYIFINEQVGKGINIGSKEVKVFLKLDFQKGSLHFIAYIYWDR